MTAITTTVTRRRFGAMATGALLAGGLGGCATPDPLEADDLPAMGRFRLVSPIVVAKDAKRVPPSRAASLADWERVMEDELTRRFGRYDGDRGYYIALAIDGYALAPPGIPIVLTPKSILVVTANLWTAAPQEKVLGPEQIVTFEGAEGFLVGSGLRKDGDAQMRTLARNMAAKVQRWILETPAVVGLPA